MHFHSKHSICFCILLLPANSHFWSERSIKDIYLYDWYAAVRTLEDGTIVARIFRWVRYSSIKNFGCMQKGGTVSGEKTLFFFHCETKHSSLSSNLAMSRDHSQHILQFYEERSLRNLVFLYLPIQDAPQSVIMFHINQSIDKFQQQNESLLEQVDRLENTLNHRDQHIIKLEAGALQHDEVFLKQLRTQLMISFWWVMSFN